MGLRLGAVDVFRHGYYRIDLLVCFLSGGGGRWEVGVFGLSISRVLARGEDGWIYRIEIHTCGRGRIIFTWLKLHICVLVRERVWSVARSRILSTYSPYSAALQIASLASCGRGW